jgi:uncharacterized membrane protein YhhN
VYFGPAWQVYLFKPLTTTLVIVLAADTALRGHGSPRRYASLIIAGLMCSLVGDVLLMLPSDRFAAGLAAFLVAHVCFTGAFLSTGGTRATPRVAAAFATYLAALLAVLLPRAGTMAVPMAVYGVALVGMGWQATERWHAVRTGAAARAAAGGVCFVLSDSALAFDRFAAPFHAASLVIMTTYIVALWLLARSTEAGDEAQAQG